MNRQYQRLLKQKGSGQADSYAIATSQPDFTPLPIDSAESKNSADPHLHQLFFTVLERQYVGQRMLEWQNYHWLFLAQTENGWQLALLFSHLGTYPPANQPLSPPRDASQSLTAQAIRLWLRDCRSGAVML
jgi:hypothetical protein